MEWLSGLTPEQQGIAGTAFLVALGVLFAWRHFAGQRTGPEKPKVQEFYAGGALADMGPVKELVEGQGLLIQQQVRTNMALEAVATALTRAAKAYEEHLKAEATQEEIEEKAQALFERRLAQERVKEDEDQRPSPRRPRA